MLTLIDNPLHGTLTVAVMGRTFFFDQPNEPQ